MHPSMALFGAPFLSYQLLPFNADPESTIDTESDQEYIMSDYRTRTVINKKRLLLLPPLASDKICWYLEQCWPYIG